MKYIALFVMTLILSASGCREKKASTVAQPAVRVDITSCDTREVAFIVNSIDASSVSYGVGTTADDAKNLGGETVLPVKRGNGRRLRSGLWRSVPMSPRFPA